MATVIDRMLSMRTLSIEPIFYVYAHVRRDAGCVFYIGKGSGRRAFVTNRRNAHWNAIVAKHGYDVVFVKSGLTEQEAMDLEIEKIREIGLDNLCNMTIGGDGATGFKMNEQQKAVLIKNLTGRVFSPESRAKISKALSGRVRDRRVVEEHAERIRGRKLSPEHVQKIVNGLTGRIVSQETREKIAKSHTGRKASQDARENMSKAHTGKTRSAESIEKQRKTMLSRVAERKVEMYQSQMKPVYCSNGMTFESLSSAASWVNEWNGAKHAKSVISASIVRGGTAYGFAWRYLEDGL